MIGCGGIIVNKNNEILLVQESNPSPTRHKKWNMPMGRSNSNESIKDTVIREIFEETGLECEIFDFLMMYDFDKDIWNTNGLFFVYLLKLKNEK